MYGSCAVSKNNKRSGWHTSIYKNLRMHENDKTKENCYKFEGEAFANVGNKKILFDKFLEGKKYAN